jgi:hypothetical protein
LCNNVAGFLVRHGGHAIHDSGRQRHRRQGVLIDGRRERRSRGMDIARRQRTEPDRRPHFRPRVVPPTSTSSPTSARPAAQSIDMPLEQGGYGIVSGTSISSPPSPGPSRDLGTATPAEEVSGGRIQGVGPWWEPGPGLLDNVHRQGAGLLTIDDAVLADASCRRQLRWVSSSRCGGHPGGCASRRPRNTGGTDATDTMTTRGTYTLGHRPALSSGPDTFALLQGRLRGGDVQRLHHARRRPPSSR